jgi:predicted permease
MALILASLSVVANRNRKDSGIGDIAVRWLALTWISTVILGVPILTAVFGDPQKGAFYGLLAGISSFVFQLPFQLFFFECHKLDCENNQRERGVINMIDNSEAEQELGKIQNGETEEQSTDDKQMIEQASSANENCHPMSRGKIWKDILIRVAKNPVIWGILLGFLISLSTFGKRFLRPLNDDKTPNSQYLRWLQFFVDSLGWFGDCVSPVSLFSMGIWMQNQGKNLVSIGVGQIALFMLSKLVIVPILMIGLAKAFQL